MRGGDGVGYNTVRQDCLDCLGIVKDRRKKELRIAADGRVGSCQWRNFNLC